MFNFALGTVYEECQCLKDVRRLLLDVLVEWVLAGRQSAMEEPRVSVPDGRDFRRRRVGYQACADCGGPQWV